MTNPKTSRSRRRRAIAALLVLVILIVVAVAEEHRVRPSILTLAQFNSMNLFTGTTGRVALLWSIETFNPRLSLEGPSGDTSPTALRIVAPNGDVVVSDALGRLDPSINTGVCPGHRPPRGTSYWAGKVPEIMADDLRASGETTYRVDVFSAASWYPVVLIDSGCRGVGRL